MNVNNLCDCVYGHTFLYVGAAYINIVTAPIWSSSMSTVAGKRSHTWSYAAARSAPVLFVKFKVFIKTRTDVDVIAIIIKNKLSK